MQPLIYFDEDVSVVYVTILEKHGFSILTTSQCEKKGQSDTAQLSYCLEKKAILVTHNISHFAELAKLVIKSGGHHPGIIAIHQLDRNKRARQINEIANKLVEYLKDRSYQDLIDAFQII